MNTSKMYILVRDDIDVGHATNAVGHGVLQAHLKFQEDEEYKSWLKDSFRKVTCKVTKQEFEEAKQFDEYIIVTEMYFDNEEIALVFKPRNEFPKRFKFYRLYS